MIVESKSVLFRPDVLLSIVVSILLVVTETKTYKFIPGLEAITYLKKELEN